MELPASFGSTPELRSLAVRDLLRGYTFGLPSGQAVAKAMNVPVLSAAELGVDHLVDPMAEVPLVYYILKEAEVQHNGERLGDVGSRIAAEVLIGLIGSDPRSYLCATEDWKPTLASAVPGDFTMADLLRFAGVA